ncbi:MAG: hypothetical protein JSS53_03585 [Proteobacteria bacterium]|nr:hypothetical protein [Pseudomonadota bacterium]
MIQYRGDDQKLINMIRDYSEIFHEFVAPNASIDEKILIVLELESKFSEIVVYVYNKKSVSTNDLQSQLLPELEAIRRLKLESGVSGFSSLSDAAISALGCSSDKRVKNYEDYRNQPSFLQRFFHPVSSTHRGSEQRVIDKMGEVENALLSRPPILEQSIQESKVMSSMPFNMP